jgi:hypothetical protein
LDALKKDLDDAIDNEKNKFWLSDMDGDYRAHGKKK